ncbi:hypothetical protein Ancab_002666 [Ancistrocladus abbreviatus]
MERLLQQLFSSNTTMMNGTTVIDDEEIRRRRRGWEPRRGVQWVWMIIGEPGARKHVYAVWLANLLRVPHISDFCGLSCSSAASPLFFHLQAGVFFLPLFIHNYSGITNRRVNIPF